MAAPGPLILLLSDVHAHYHVVDAQVAHAEEACGRPVEQVIVLGDFGLFGANLRAYFRRSRQRFARPVAFLEGNHEDYREFDALVREFADVFTHLPRGSCHQVGPHRGLCIGGARYMDAWSTPRGSEIGEQDIAACLAQAPGSVDLVLSHDCPAGIGVASAGDLGHLGPPGVADLTRVADHLRPRWWVFGHHHRWHTAERGGTRYLGLPQSWLGYALLDGDADDAAPRPVRHEVPVDPSPRWWRLLGLR